MAIDLTTLLDPGHTVLVLQECQNGVIGPQSALPALATSTTLIPNLARLATAARAAGVRVIHCTAHHRVDGFGSNRNARLFRAMDKSPVKLHVGSHEAAPVAEVGPEPEDLVLPRIHGLSPFQGTELDSILRNAKITTIVGVGVSVNVAITNFTFDAVNAGYAMVIARDAVVGFPAEYVDMVFENTLGLLATVTTTEAVVDTWTS